MRRNNRKVKDDGRALAQVEANEGRLRREMESMMRRHEERERRKHLRERAMEDSDFGDYLGKLWTGERLTGKPPGSAPGSFVLEVQDSGFITCDATGAAVVCTAPQPYFSWCTEGTPGGNAVISIGEPIVPGDVNKRSDRFLAVVQSFGGTVRTIRRAFTVSCPDNYTSASGMVTLAYLSNTQPVQQTQESLATRPGAQTFPLASLIEHPRVCPGVFTASSTFEGVNTTGGDSLIEQFTFDPDIFFENVTPTYPAVDSIVDANHLASPHWYIAVGAAPAGARIYVTSRATYEIIPLAGISVETSSLHIAGNMAQMRSAALTLGDLGPFAEPTEDIVGVDMGDIEDGPDDVERMASALEKSAQAVTDVTQQKRVLKAAAALREAAPSKAGLLRRSPVQVHYRATRGRVGEGAERRRGLREKAHELMAKHYGLGGHDDGWWSTTMRNIGSGLESVLDTLFDAADLGRAAVDDPEVQGLAQRVGTGLELAAV